MGVPGRHKAVVQEEVPAALLAVREQGLLPGLCCSGGADGKAPAFLIVRRDELPSATAAPQGLGFSL